VPPLPVPLLAVNAAVAREVALGAELVRFVGERALAAHEALHAEGLSNEGVVVNGQCLGGNWVFEYGREGAY
jgi:dienelactone hydrolase